MKKIQVVGGGSAGWMAAAYLNARLNYGGRKIVDVCLVESPDIPRISVGEATIPNIQHILSVIGIDEIQFMKATDATFKQSIKYENWLQNDNSYYHHPFSRYRTLPIDRNGIHWLHSDRSQPFMHLVSDQPQICDKFLAPKMLGQWDFGSPLNYAFHMNAQKFADYLCAHSTARGVHHILANVVDIKMTETGEISHLKTDNDMTLEADLFIDCTGFAAILIEKKIGVKFIDCSKWLLCNKAITMHVPYEEHYPGFIRPFTRATALSSGWVWDIPLQNLRSRGYVYSGDFTSDDDAETELKAHEGVHSESLSTRIISFKVGHREKAWAGNCVSIGLSGGFIEPLESTGLYLSDLASVMLAEHFPYTEVVEPLRNRFNRIMVNRFYEILDFINMHYCLTKRTDTDFWKEVQKPERINDRLKAKFEYWRLKPPSPNDFEDSFLPSMCGNNLPGMGGDLRPPMDTAGLWNHESYECIMYGMDWEQERYLQEFGPNLAQPRIPDYILKRLSAAPHKLPTHEEWLQKMVGMKNYN
ncbi:MAG: tryptophan halogenase family protein [Sphingomonadales bacterium]